MGKQFLSARKVNSLGVLVQVVLGNPFGGTNTFSKKIIINQQYLCLKLLHTKTEIKE
jgi:hypothetical protein